MMVVELQKYLFIRIQTLHTDVHISKRIFCGMESHSLGCVDKKDWGLIHCYFLFYQFFYYIHVGLGFLSVALFFVLNLPRSCILNRALHYYELFPLLEGFTLVSHKNVPVHLLLFLCFLWCKLLLFTAQFCRLTRVLSHHFLDVWMPFSRLCDSTSTVWAWHELVPDYFFSSLFHFY